VFSIVDSFAYLDAGSPDIRHLTAATADYFVIGWHSNPKDGPLPPKKLPNSKEDRLMTLEERLSALMLSLDRGTGPDAAQIEKLLESEDAAQVVLHGAIYNVRYDANTKPRSLADEAAIKFTPDVKMEPLSIGTTPLDGIVTFLEAHQKDIEQILGPGTSSAANDVLQLATLLYAADDKYDSRVRAQDLLYTNNWTSEQGGFEWKFDGKAGAGKSAAVPTISQSHELAILNDLQARFDVLSRKIKGKRWTLFAEWWKFVSDRSNVTAEKEGPYRARVAALKQEISSLQKVADNLAQSINQKSGVTTASNAQSTVPCKKVPQDVYFTRKDPTLCIAGLDSGWPTDYLSNIPVQVNHQLNNPLLPGDLGRIFGSASNPVRSNLQNTANRLLAECLSRTGSADPVSLPKGYKLWGAENPFCPVFVEWEATYYHIDRTKWEVGVRPSPVGHAHSQVRFTVNEPLYNDQSMQKDYRRVSGRVMILPQPVFSLQAIVAQVLDNPSPQALLDTTQVQKIKDNIAKLKFISAPLDGLTQHLLTRYVGTHVSPNIRTQGKKNVPLRDAVISSDPIGFGEDGMMLIDSER
jgi:hypothetical protein